MAGTFHVSVITPERAVLETEATSVIFPAHDGEVGVLRNRAPLLYRLGVGLLKVETASGRQVLFIAGGFAQMVDNRLTLLTEQAKEPEKIDRAAAEKALEEARAMKVKDDASLRARDLALRSAKLQIRLAGH
ncbi:MAG TPA: ATP synthase F1 subunit epsilon [Thermoanaerobaculia bacterium]